MALLEGILLTSVVNYFVFRLIGKGGNESQNTDPIVKRAYKLSHLVPAGSNRQRLFT